MVQKFIVGKFGVEKFMVGKSGVEKSRVEWSGVEKSGTEMSFNLNVEKIRVLYNAQKFLFPFPLN